MVVYSAGPPIAESLKSFPHLDHQRTIQLVTDLFPKDQLEAIGDGDLSCTSPPKDEIHIGCFPHLSIVAARDFAIDYPSHLPPSFVSQERGATTYLHAMHSVVDWFAFAKWSDGELVRSLSLSPDSGILEDIGEHLPFESPFWAGKFTVADEYPFAFHPLDLGEAALKEFFGYQLEGPIDSQLLNPESIPLIRYKRKRSWWKFL